MDDSVRRPPIGDGSGTSKQSSTDIATSTIGQLQDDLHEYLHDTCEHHWRYEDNDEDFPLRQCIWCHTVAPQEAHK